MANPEHLAVLEQGVAVWNKWRDANPDIKPDLTETILVEANLRWASLSGTNLREANLIEANLIEANLSKANLSKANLSKANLRWANLSGTDLIEANLNETYLVEANLCGASLNWADLREANLCGASLNGADLREANLCRSNLHKANLHSANLREANLCGANLCGASLNGADFSEANLSRASLHGTNLSGAILRDTSFSDINLTKVEGLDTCHHYGPSTLDFRTLQRSGPLPLAFLRGCGLPDLLIDYLPSLLNQPIQFYSCFISYSSKDEEFARRLHADLQNEGVRCWYAPEDIKGGQKIYEQIGEAIRLHEKLLLILSEHSMESEWVKTEIAEARQREVREKRQVLFPISLVAYEKIKQWDYFDADVGKSSAREIREYFIPDFSHWKKHDDYQQAFDRLLRDLKPELERKPEKW